MAAPIFNEKMSRSISRVKSFEVTLKIKIGALFLLARSLSLIARINDLQLLARIKDIWSDKEQRSLRKKLFVSRLLQTSSSGGPTQTERRAKNGEPGMMKRETVPIADIYVPVKWRVETANQARKAPLKQFLTEFPG
jgi:hypothetical protein